MLPSVNGVLRSESDFRLMLTYVTNLELEVDRLRRQGQFIRQQVRETLRSVRSLCGAPHSDLPLADLNRAAEQLATVLRDLQETPSYHPAHDQVVAIAVRPLIERVFRWQQRLQDAADVELRLELQVDHMDWFPARLRHILDNLISNALRYRDGGKDEAWVGLSLRLTPAGYELSVSDNGLGLSARTNSEVFELLYRAAPTREAGVGVGLAVVKLLVEQSGGALSVGSGEGQGTTFLAVLPRFDVDDFLT
jgi:signal transduction histidine kinase